MRYENITSVGPSVDGLRVEKRGESGNSAIEDLDTGVRHIVFAVAPDFVLLDACGPLEAFHRAELTVRDVREVTSVDGEACSYRTTVGSIGGGILSTFAGLPVVSTPLESLDGQSIDTLIIPGIPVDEGHLLQPELVEWIASRAPNIRRVCSVCSGAFYLAEAGLLDGRRATTHWREASRLAERFPNVRVDAEPIFIRETVSGTGDRSVWTSAGVTSGIDLALALIQEDYGHTIAMQVARRLVVYVKRPGGQSQFSAILAAQTSEGGAFDSLHGWMASNLNTDLSVDRLAEAARMSPRTFARRYVDEVGRTPAKTVAALRLEAASRALAETQHTLKRISLDCGFGSEQNLRRAFVRRFGVLPQDYRQRFAVGTG
jgi:transcriptional regulator GlxA family with amidase domain